MKKLFKRVEFWMSIVAIVIGVALGIYNIVNYAVVNRKLDEYTHINAVVVDNKLVDEGEFTYEHQSFSTFAAVVEYDVDGVTYRAQDKISSSFLKKTGVSCEIAYNPDNPAECLFIKSEKLLFVILIIFSACFMVVGVVFIVFIIKSLRRNNRGETA